MSNDFHFLRQDLFYPHEVADIPGHTEESGKFQWIDGKPFEDSPKNLSFYLDTAFGRTLPDFFDTTIPVMSEKLVEALRLLMVHNFETYPVSLIYPEGDFVHGYSAVNVVGTLDIIDWSRTVHKKRFNKLKATHQIHLLDEGNKNLDIFRLTGGPGFIVVTPNVAHVLGSLGLKAVLLQPLSAYNDI